MKVTVIIFTILFLEILIFSEAFSIKPLDIRIIGLIAEDEQKKTVEHLRSLVGESMDSLNLGERVYHILPGDIVEKILIEENKKIDIGLMESKGYLVKFKESDYLIILTSKYISVVDVFRKLLIVDNFEIPSNEDDSKLKEILERLFFNVFYNGFEWRAAWVKDGIVFADPRGKRFGDIIPVRVRVYKKISKEFEEVLCAAKPIQTMQSGAKCSKSFDGKIILVKPSNSICKSKECRESLSLGKYPYFARYIEVQSLKNTIKLINNSNNNFVVYSIVGNAVRKIGILSDYKEIDKKSFAHPIFSILLIPEKYDVIMKGIKTFDELSKIDFRGKDALSLNFEKPIELKISKVKAECGRTCVVRYESNVPDMVKEYVVKVYSERGELITELKTHSNEVTFNLGEYKGETIEIKIEGVGVDGEEVVGKSIKVKIDRPPKLELKAHRSLDRKLDYVEIKVEDPDLDEVFLSAYINDSEVKVKDHKVYLKGFEFNPDDIVTVKVVAEDDHGWKVEKTIHERFQLNQPPKLHLPDYLRSRNGERLYLDAEDPDGDPLYFEVYIDGEKVYIEDHSVKLEFLSIGKHRMHVKVKDLYGKSDEKDVELEILDSKPELHLSVHPRKDRGLCTNPVYLSVEIKDPDGVRGIGKVIVSKEGQTIFSKTLRFKCERCAHVSKSLDLPFLKSGLYEISLTFGSETTSEKLIIRNRPSLRIQQKKHGKNVFFKLKTEDKDDQRVCTRIVIFKNGRKIYEDCVHSDHFEYELRERGAYEFKFTPVDEDGVQGDTKTVLILEEGPPPEPPILRYPVDGAIIQQTENVVLKWEKSPFDSDIKYEVYVGNSPNRLVSFGTTKDNRMELGTLKPGKFYWKVVVRDSFGREAESEVRSFLVVGYLLELSKRRFGKNSKVLSNSKHVYILEDDRIIKFEDGEVINSKIYKPDRFVIKDDRLLLFDRFDIVLLSLEKPNSGFSRGMFEDILDANLCGDFVAVVGDDYLKIFDESGRKIYEEDLPMDEYRNVVCTIKGIVTSYRRGHIAYFNGNKLWKIRLLERDDLTFMVASPGGEYIATVNTNGKIRVYEIKDKIDCIYKETFNMSYVNYITMTNKNLVVQDEHEILYIIGLKEKKLKFKMELDWNVVGYFELGDLLLLVSEYDIRLYDKYYSLLRLIKTQCKLTSAVVFENKLYVMDEGGTLTIYKIR